MTEQIVSFEVAQLARELGFNLETPYFYNHEFTLCDPNRIFYAGCEEGIEYDEYFIDWNNYSYQQGPNSPIIEPNYYSAPAQSLLQKWLREKYELHITIHYHKNRVFSCGVVNEVDLLLNTSLFGESFKNYEEALEAGLLEALKYLKEND